MAEKDILRIENRDTLHLKVCNVIREAILKGEFKPGERLKQADLADVLGVSRMPVREAFRILESEGLIKLEPHKGAIVKSIRLDDIEEIYVLRAELEKMAMLQSFETLTDEDLHQLLQLADKMEMCEEVADFIGFNIEFHRLLIKKCKWERLNTFISTLWNGLPQQTPHFIKGQKDLSNVEHRAILNAVLRNEKAAAAALLSKHISRTGEMLIRQLREEGQQK